MKKILTGLLAVGLAMGAAAPARADDGGFGLILGALGGGVLGHQVGHGAGNTWATAIGAVSGAVIGQNVGNSLDRGNRAYYSQRASYGYYQQQPAYYRVHPRQVYYVPSYEQRVTTYEVRPAPVAVVDNSVSTDGRYCREYQSNVTVGGHVQGGYGTACMQPDGSWQVIQ